MEDNPTRFVVLFQGRSGSTYFVEALDSHPRVTCEVEQLVGLRKQGAKAQLDWVARHFDRLEAGNSVGAIGFKTKLDDVIDKNQMAQLLRKSHAKVINLTRRNVVKVVVSWFNCERIFAATGDWNLYPPADFLGPLNVDPVKFEKRLNLVLDGKARLSAYVERLELPVLSLTYEELFLNEAEVYVRACKFLNVPPMPMRGRCEKATDDDLRKVLTNFGDVVRHFRGSIFEEMFDEVSTR